MNSPMTRRLAAIALLACGFAALHMAGPIVGNPRWPVNSLAFGAIDPLIETAAVLRPVAMVACAWLATVTMIDMVAQLARAHLLSRLAATLAPAAWRNLVLRPVAVATLAAPQVLVPMTAVAPVAAHVPTEVDLDITTSSAPDVEPPPSGTTLEMTTYDNPTRTLTMTLHEPTSVDSSPAATPGRDQATAEDTRVRLVDAGENLWSIAAEHLSDELGRRPSPSEITPYWHAVIDANRHVLPDPENPDLLYRGIELTMPPVAD